MTEMKRHHALSLLWSLGNLLKSTFAFILFLFVFRAGSDQAWVFYARIIFYIGICIALISIIWKWFTTRYSADEKAFHIYTGAFSRTRRTIPYTKVQNVSRHTSFVHRLFGVTSIRFETGIKGDDATFQLQVVSVSEAEQLEKRVARHLSEVQATVEGIMDDEQDAKDEKSLLAEQYIETEEQAGSDSSANANNNDTGIKGTFEHVVHYRSTRKDVFKASFTSLSFLVLIPILGSLYSTVKDFFPDETVTESLVLTWLESWWVTSLVILLLILVSVGLGIVRTFVKYGDFQITSDDKRIYITKGMLEKTSFSIQKDRVQAVKITQSLMKRMLGLAEVELTTAGSLGEASQEINTLYPFLPVREAYRIIEEMLPSYHVTEEMHRLPQKALWLRLLKPNGLWIIVTGVLIYFKPVLFGMEQTWWMISLLLLVWITTCKVINFYHTRYALNDQFIQFRSGALTSTLFLSKREKVIEIKITRHPLQRKLGLASIHTVNRAKPVMHQYVHDIPDDVAGTFQMWYMRRSNEVQIR
ncbi:MULTISPECIES: PH domain-containing protein [Paenibacillus]|uniref:PH domain-containing protein n=1 Tax=Paenibacillus cucumis (ex Kampfer et al. 2016) TaxID=1776858 RepID=A0ABS7KDU6_9BACL|nr:PH domain-containing protein [Paenibacillus cucumis (ex Kampfer et al. 2016)]MBY0202305.1 PH domain-containing protein [Paenibacillus cucumis (ex Kampfer et al. 2016)]